MMRHLDIRSFVLGIAVIAALAIGTFVVLGHSDQPAQAAPQASQSRAVPQGVTDLNFECVSLGITVLMNQMLLNDYTCHSDASIDIVCNPNQAQTTVECSDGTNTSTCTITAGTDNSQAECTDTDGGSHVCSFGASGVDCENTGGAVGKDYIGCYQDGPFGQFACGTQDGPMVCMLTPDENLTFICQTLSSTPEYLWADVDCDGEISSRDNQALLRRVLGNTPLSQTEPCPNAGDPVSLQPNRFY